MYRSWRCAVALSVTVFLAACGGKGVDKKLSTDSETAYHESLNTAWVDMTLAQQNAYNWAVNNYTLEGLVSTYPEITPRKIIDAEADAQIARRTSQIASTTAELAKNAERLANDERQLNEAIEELSKITFKPLGLKRSFSMRGPELEYIVNNGSKYDISSLSFDAWVFVDDEERSERKCRLSGYYQFHNGLPQGKSMKTTSSSGFGCRSWDTLEVKNAKALSFRIDLDPQSVKNFGEKIILPTLSKPTRSDYEQRIQSAKDAVAEAMQAKASLAVGS